jgi:hypothetical protein
MLASASASGPVVGGGGGAGASACVVSVTFGYFWLLSHVNTRMGDASGTPTDSA